MSDTNLTEKVSIQEALKALHAGKIAKCILTGKFYRWVEHYQYFQSSENSDFSISQANRDFSEREVMSPWGIIKGD